MRGAGTFLQSGFDGKTFRIAPISRDFRGDAARFLCVADCVAERAVWIEPLSPKFPANREKYREFRVFAVEISCEFSL
jgi:hypothetical protein